ncbi:MAG: hypothetical protein EPN36_11860 [Rhodanobacteraceae bacterium]|nr:MAG: hypothetical protein EPN36_11860 [Rhodanobacteraceae bacterium]
MTDEAIILAGGLGTRLQGVLRNVPKPLAPVAGRPFLAWLLDRLAEQGMRRVVLATGHLAEQVETALGDRWRDMLLEYSRELRPLGTGGAIALAAQRVRGDAFFVLNGDTELQLDYMDFDRHAASSGARLGVALAKVPDTARYGAVRVERGHVAGFSEKGRAGAGYINAGVYRLQRSLLDNYAKAEAFSFEHEVLVPAVQHEPVIAYTHTSGFIDIGVPEDYRRAQVLFAARMGDTA